MQVNCDEIKAMKKIILIFLIQISTAIYIFAQWDVKHVETENTTLNVIKFFDEDLGFAMGGSGKILRSTDQGENWVGATILADEVIADGSHKHFGWVRWVAKLNVPLGKHATVSVCSRATDTDGKTQAKTPPKERGYLYNGWSKVEVNVCMIAW